MLSQLVLQVAGVSKSFGGLQALNDVHLTIERGQVYGLIGPNGAGKTTFFNVITGLYPADSGSFVLADHSYEPRDVHLVAKAGIARTFQNIELFEHASVLHNLLIGRHVHQHTGFWQQMLFLPSVRAEEIATRRKVEEVIDFLDLQHYRDTMVAGLPYGIRKVVELARALCTEPQLLLLDEPSSGLNVEETADMAFWIQDIQKDLGITVLMVEHDMSLVSKVSDRVLAMNQGEVLAVGTAAQVQSHPAVIEAYLGGTLDVSAFKRETTGAA
ncbi:MAG: ABC transporter ATP-binding protein [Betaproteobacteria bacterium]|nr:ABC transporter ATP-binding protein [Betaproteobacteria bacterium]